jgi:S-adenosylmethionine:tRNA ribosyltransferase-isomerase
MKLSDFEYVLPKILIAKTQMDPRDHSRLLVLDKKSGKLIHHTFYEVVDFLKEGDLLVLNDSKVFPARLFGHRKDTGGKIETLLNHQLKDGTWEVVGKNLKLNSTIIFSNNISAKILGRKNEIFIIQFNIDGKNFWKAIEKIGHTPLPPYIDKRETSSDIKNYQTVYADKTGSVAAPTAGLHFTKGLLKKIERKGIILAKLTLHVGMGTWSSIKTKEIEDHKIHSEFYEVPEETVEKILQTKKNGGRVIAVGTTTTRVLEHLFSTYNLQLTTDDLIGQTNIYIYPGYEFKVIDGLITNFHLPKSSLLLLVSAFAGKKNIKRAYAEAISKKYRFYSYGDAMLIL